MRISAKYFIYWNWFGEEELNVTPLIRQKSFFFFAAYYGFLPKISALFVLLTYILTARLPLRYRREAIRVLSIQANVVDVDSHAMPAIACPGIIPLIPVKSIPSLANPSLDN